jgi:hypothetical protein
MEAFSFEDAEVVVCPMLTIPLPGHGAHRLSDSSASLHPLPGTLSGGSPRPVMSGVVMRGGEEETRARLVHVSHPTKIYGGVIGAVDKRNSAQHTRVSATIDWHTQRESLNYNRIPCMLCHLKRAPCMLLYFQSWMTAVFLLTRN